MTDNFPYPMWVICCRDCPGGVTVWEKPGTGCGYIDHCPQCGGETIEVRRVDNKEEHEKAKSRPVGQDQHERAVDRLNKVLLDPMGQEAKDLR